MARLRDMDESQLIRAFRALLPVGGRTLVGIGDDCAQIAAPEGSFLVTTDVIVEDHHFHSWWSTPYQIGARAAAQNLSDIAGMGGRASALVVSVSVSRDADADWLLDVVRGLGDRAREAGAGVVGGDLSGGDRLVLSVTAFGYCQGSPVLRDGARPGDTVGVAGTLGWSYAGLDLLRGGVVRPGREPEALAPFVRTYCAPRPPLEAGPAAASAGASAMMDLSDGLAMDGGRMARASGVVIELDRRALGREAEALAGAAAACGKDPLDWVVGGGEDQGILAAFPPGTALPDGFRAVGAARAPRGGEEPHIQLDGAEVFGPWDHFAGSSADESDQIPGIG